MNEYSTVAVMSQTNTDDNDDYSNDGQKSSKKQRRKAGPRRRTKTGCISKYLCLLATASP